MNFPSDGIELHQDPTGGRYTRVRTARRGETLTPREFPGMTLRVDDILG